MKSIFQLSYSKGSIQNCEHKGVDVNHKIFKPKIIYDLCQSVKIYSCFIVGNLWIKLYFAVIICNWILNIKMNVTIVLVILCHHGSFSVWWVVLEYFSYSNISQCIKWQYLLYLALMEYLIIGKVNIEIPMILLQPTEIKDEFKNFHLMSSFY